MDCPTLRRRGRKQVEAKGKRTAAADGNTHTHTLQVQETRKVQFKYQAPATTRLGWILGCSGIRWV
jgi:hypothetical protein